VRCQGRFRLDVEKMAANFEKQVSVVRKLPDGSADELSCDLLTIYFDKPGTAPQQPLKGQQTRPAVPRRRPLEVTRIQARGQPGQPAVASSATAPARVEGEYLELDIRGQRVFFSDPREVTVKFQDTQLVASQVRYLAGTRGELGKLWASGPGNLRSQLPGGSGQTLQAAWQGQLQIRPHQGQQLVSLVEKVEVSASQTGSLQSDEIWIWLRPTPVAAAGKPPEETARYEPERMLATGHVAINSTPLSGAVDRLEAWFLPSNPPAPAGPSPPGNMAGLASRRDFRGTQNHYHLRGKSVRLQFATVHRKPVLQDASIDGDVYLVERAASGDAEQPLSVRGQQIDIRQVDTPQAALSVTGRPAQVTARGLSIFGPAVHVSKEANTIWVDGAGKMTLPVDRDLQGNQLADRQSLDVHWQNRLVFDGQKARFEDNIVASSQHQKLQTRQLEVILNQRILFGQSAPQAIEVQQVICRGGVVLDSSSFSGQQLASREKLHVDNMSIHQATGEIHAQGPGWFQSVRRGSTVQLAGKPGQSAASPPAGGPAEQGLVFLKVEFQRAITGNLHRRELAFGDQTRCIYGPVSDWSQELDLDKPSGPAGQEVILTCDQLALRQMGPASEDRRPIEIEATGNATVEGASFT
ncbi:MAG: hypothetical protein GTO03_00385, partial [Planctomycetales bacterium]|nr:hypothetical protein [Planctomycetales bacterium]